MRTHYHHHSPSTGAAPLVEHNTPRCARTRPPRARTDFDMTTTTTMMIQLSHGIVRCFSSVLVREGF
eukprot:9669876-Prorocentrum_lima.AAC.1